MSDIEYDQEDFDHEEDDPGDEAEPLSEEEMTEPNG